MSPAILEVDDIHAYYGSAHILHGVSFELERGTCLGILGRNGVGKTTTTRSIVGFTPPRQGRIVFDGVDIAGWKARRINQAGVALVPQGRRIFGSLTVEENLRVARQAPKPGQSEWTLERVYDLFPRLRERPRQRAGTLSGGEQQMLAVGRALMTQPSLLVLDEPTEGLAPVIIDVMVAALLELKRTDVSLLLTEQRVEVAERLADRIVEMGARGRISEQERDVSPEPSTT